MVDNITYHKRKGKKHNVKQYWKRGKYFRANIDIIYFGHNIKSKQ